MNKICVYNRFFEICFENEKQFYDIDFMKKILVKKSKVVENGSTRPKLDTFCFCFCFLLLSRSKTFTDLIRKF